MRTPRAAAPMKRLVLLPGMDGTGALFERFVAAAPEDVATQVVAFPPDRALGYAELARLVQGALPADGPYVLLGESFSGPLALRLAADAPPGLSAVVLCATFLRAPVAARRLAWLGGVMGRPRLPGWVLARLLTGGDAELARDVQEATDRVDAAVLGRRIRAIAGVDARPHLVGCPVPVTVLRAARDRLVGPAASQEIADLRPTATVHDVDAPHLLLQTAPGTAWDLLAPLLR